MEVSLILWTSFLSLVGLQLCIPENPNGRFEAEFNERWCTHSPLLRMFYGLSNILGALFVLGMVGYLTFTEHWWYLHCLCWRYHTCKNTGLFIKIAPLSFI